MAATETDTVYISLSQYLSKTHIAAIQEADTNKLLTNTYIYRQNIDPAIK